MLKKCWITYGDGTDLCSITLESDDPLIPVTAREINFPAEPTPECPLRHTMNIGVFTQNDIDLLAKLLDQYRTPIR